MRGVCQTRLKKGVQTRADVLSFYKWKKMFNIINNASSEPLQRKMEIEQRGYNLRSVDDGTVKVPDKGKKSCTGFSYYGPKMIHYTG